MDNRPPIPQTSWRQTVSPPHRKHRHAFSNSHVSLGAIHMANLIVGMLATDRMKDPAARWATITGLGIASGIGETIWRERIERERGQDPNKRA